MPPSAKALDWFCCQPESSTVYPLFFISKDTKNPDYMSLCLNETRGVFGIGAAVNFKRASSCISGEKTTIKRLGPAFLVCELFLMPISHPHSKEFWL